MNTTQPSNHPAEEREDEHAPVWVEDAEAVDETVDETGSAPALVALYTDASSDQAPRHGHDAEDNAGDDDRGDGDPVRRAGEPEIDGNPPAGEAAKPARADADGAGMHRHEAGREHSHHHHAQAPMPGQGRAFALAVALNLAIVVLQAIYGVLAHSSALLADAGHNLSDVLGLLLAWGAFRLARRRPSARYTFGLGSSSILAALANAALLLFACGVIVAEAVRQLLHPQPVAGLDVFVVATIGMLVNGFSAWLFVRGQQHDLNVRGAFLHLASDAAVSAAVAVSGLVVLATGWTRLDPLMSLAVVAVVLIGTWGLLRDSVRLALNAVPSGIDLAGIRAFLLAQPGVADVHDLHVWALSTTGNALSAHLVMPAGHPGDAMLDALVHELREGFGVHHTTLQVDLGTSRHDCTLETLASGQ